MEKQKKSQQEIMEEQVYAKLWEMDILKKVEREKKEAEQKKKLIGETMTLLDWQKDTREENKQSNKQMTDMERGMLND